MPQAYPKARKEKAAEIGITTPRSVIDNLIEDTAVREWQDRSVDKGRAASAHFAFLGAHDVFIRGLQISGWKVKKYSKVGLVIADFNGSAAIGPKTVQIEGYLKFDTELSSLYVDVTFSA